MRRESVLTLGINLEKSHANIRCKKNLVIQETCSDRKHHSADPSEKKKKFPSDSGDPLLERIKVQNTSIFFHCMVQLVQLNRKKKAATNSTQWFKHVKQIRIVIKSLQPSAPFLLLSAAIQSRETKYTLSPRSFAAKCVFFHNESVTVSWAATNTLCEW